MSNQQDIMAELLKNLIDKDPENEEQKNYGEDDLALLKAACEKFLQQESFEVGQIVKWKKGLKNKKLPHQNQPAIVVGLLDEPVIDRDGESGSPYFLEKLNIILGIISDDDTFLTFYYDRSRFESY
jgi:hypothetical protein